MDILGYKVTIYGLFLASSMLIGLFFLIVESKRTQVNQNLVLGATIFGIVGALAGARAFYVLFNWDYYNGDIEKILNIRDGGLAFYGALFGGIIFVSLFCTFSKLDFMKVADIMCPGILIVQIAGKIGEYFLSPQLLYLCEAAWCLGMLIFIMATQRSKKYSGEVFMRYLVLYDLFRCIIEYFKIEYFKIDTLLIPNTNISISMVISGILFVVFFIVSTVKSKIESKRAARKRRRLEQKISE